MGPFALIGWRKGATVPLLARFAGVARSHRHECLCYGANGPTTGGDVHSHMICRLDSHRKGPQAPHPSRPEASGPPGKIGHPLL